MRLLTSLSVVVIRCLVMRKLVAAAVVITALALLLLSESGGFLVVNDLQHADLILVIAGETDRRPSRGIDLLRKGYAPKLMLDVPAEAKVFDQETIKIAQDYIQKFPERERISICPIFGLSTKSEAQDVKRCLAQVSSKRILLVTSDYHTRRALSIFRHELSGREVFIAAAEDPAQFGGHWWTHRQWAKMNLDECLKLAWWEIIDRWRR